MGSDIRLLVLDIDGTIAGDSNEVSPTVIDAITTAKAKGVKVAIATGRMYQSALRFHQVIGSDMPLAAYQGAILRDPRTDELHHHYHLPSEMAQTLLYTLAQFPLEAIHVYVNDNLYIQAKNPLSDWYAERSRVQLHLIEDLNGQGALPPTKVLGMTQDTQLIDELLEIMRAQFPPDQLYLTKSLPTFFEATHPGINKGIAVKYMAEDLLGLAPEQVMVVGDSYNDVEMFDYAGTAVAMGNAEAPVKARSSWQAPSIDEDGVAAAIEEFIR
ncbi:MAG: Cof-type HAD-IIB family hydrolase [Cyanobacteria bacterium P01_A01_bin.3]